MLTLLINGKKQQVDVPDDMPLLWVLRDELGITGPKYGCGIGQCGACTVHIDGIAVRSCPLAAADVDGQAITVRIGVAALSAEDENFQRLFERADAALYEAKRGGRNQLQFQTG